jgi:C-terminal processing protease CtpA/Prc
VNAKRLTLVAGTLAATAAVAYAQLGGYTQSDLTKTATGKTLLQVIGDLNQYYLYPVDQEKLLRGAINGAIGSLNDEFTYYSEPANNAVDQQNLSGEFYGIGVTLVASNADGTGGKIDNVYKNGAAAANGVQIGDVFVKIGDKDVLTSKLDEIVRLVRGTKGTFVNVTFARDGKTYNVKMERQPVVIVSVEETILPGNIGYIALNTFYNEKASDQFTAAVAEKRATIVGEQTFGKGVAQIPITTVDGGKVAIVNSAWLTPLGREIHKKGITPDVVVKDTRYVTPLNFSGGGIAAGSKLTITVAGKPVTVTADKDGKFTYTGEVKRPSRSTVQGEAVVDTQNDAQLKKALELLK